MNITENGLIYIFGGRDEHGRTNDMYICNLYDLRWEKVIYNTNVSEIPRGR